MQLSVRSFLTVDAFQLLQRFMGRFVFIQRVTVSFKTAIQRHTQALPGSVLVFVEANQIVPVFRKIFKIVSRCGDFFNDRVFLFLVKDPVQQYQTFFYLFTARVLSTLCTSFKNSQLAIPAAKEFANMRDQRLFFTLVKRLSSNLSHQLRSFSQLCFIMATNFMQTQIAVTT